MQKRVVSSDHNFDSLLSAVELSCLVSSAIVSVDLAVNGSKNWLLMVSGNKVSVVWGVLMLMSGVAVGLGAWIRRRQWRRLGRESGKGGLMERVEKLEEDLRSTMRVLRVLSRHAEKLGKRIRGTRHALKDPITQSATVAQKNSEATRAVAVQYEILEKEIREIQKVLLAMQEQQEKQLDLILSLGKPGKPWEIKDKTLKEQNTLETTNSAEDEVEHVEDHQI